MTPKFCDRSRVDRLMGVASGVGHMVEADKLGGELLDQVTT